MLSFLPPKIWGTSNILFHNVAKLLNIVVRVEIEKSTLSNLFVFVTIRIQKIMNSEKIYTYHGDSKRQEEVFKLKSQ